MIGEIDKMCITYNNILVTGATGFVGRHLVQRLCEAGKRVSIITRDVGKANRVFANIKSGLSMFDRVGSVSELADFMRKQEIECVIHLATCYITKSVADDIDELVEANISFGLRVLEAMKLAGIHHLISASTSWQHYQDADYEPVNLYAATKQAFDDLLLYYVKAEKVNAICLELYDTYGTRDERNKLMPYWQRAMLTGEEIVMSQGAQKLSYVYIEDVINAFCRAMELLDEQPEEMTGTIRKYAVSTGEIVTLHELSTIFQRVSGRTLNIRWGALPYREREVMRPYEGTPVLPGWKARYSLQEGIAEMLAKNK